VPTLVCYVSGHGFGHAVRVVEVLRALRLRRPDVAVAIRTVVPRWFIETSLEGPCTFASVRLDVGAVQADSLHVDPEATLRAYAEIAAHTEQLVDAECAALAALRPAAVFADIPALAFEIAARLGVPSIGLTNFSWDWIYADYVRDWPQYASLVDGLRAGYARATRLLRLPLHGDLSAFPLIQDIPLVARRAALAPLAVRQRLALPAADRLVLLSFGGMGLTLASLPAPPRGVTFVVTQSAEVSGPPRGCRFVTNDALHTAGVRYEDLIAACDVVLTKPGYGIVADCLANGTPIVYTPRGRFAEYAVLVSAIHTHLPHAFISNEDLFAGRWAAALEAVFAQPRRQADVDVTGATVAAEVLSNMTER
jgi:UDP:flavonoid glycosyltransferase YjiC (YdhE family)